MTVPSQRANPPQPSSPVVSPKALLTVSRRASTCLSTYLGTSLSPSARVHRTRGVCTCVHARIHTWVHSAAHALLSGPSGPCPHPCPSGLFPLPSRRELVFRPNLHPRSPGSSEDSSSSWRACAPHQRHTPVTPLGPPPPCAPREASAPAQPRVVTGQDAAGASAGARSARVHLVQAGDPDSAGARGPKASACFKGTKVCSG